MSTLREVCGNLAAKWYLFIFCCGKESRWKKKRKTRAFLSKMQHPPTHKVTAGMSLNYLMEDCWSCWLTWQFFSQSKNVGGHSYLAPLKKLVELQTAIAPRCFSECSCCLSASAKSLEIFCRISYPFDKVIEGQMKVSALCTKLINLAAILQHKNIPLTLHGNGRKDQKENERKKEEKQQVGVQMKRVYEKAE